jgi:hypothetical protein
MGLLKVASLASIVLGVTGSPLDGKSLLVAGGWRKRKETWG